MICSTCHGTGRYHNNLLGEMLPCIDCNGSGFAYCCEHYDDVLTHGVKEMALTRIVYHEYEIHPDQTGWYIKEYSSLADLQNEVPCDVIGPFATRLAAQRMLDTPEEPETPSARKKPYDPSRDPIPARSTEASKAGDVHMELQQTQELRDMPEALQGD